ncbi:MAG: hypothetical protein LBS18_04270 [Clostridiales bacterium]|jgi:hypothetical protein|nr:hypothetical protein [Clostridiales bacterium]
MKRNVLVGILVIEALLCVVLRILQASFSDAFFAVMAFPFEQIGSGLRLLSLSGDTGNIAAIVFYFLISLLPAAALLVVRKKRGLRVEDGLLGLLSAVLFAVLYLMINPGVIGTLTGGTMGQSTGKAIAGGMVYAVLCGYFVLRVLRLFFVGGTDKLVRYMSVMLSLLNVLFVYLAFGARFDEMLNSSAALQAGNAGNEHLLGASHVFLVVQFLVDALPFVLNVFVVFAALRLLCEMRADRYSAETVSATERMSRLCAVALAATVLSNIGFNLLQFLFVKSLMVVNGSVQIPVFSITFVLAALLLTRFVAENKQLKEDNDLFV